MKKSLIILLVMTAFAGFSQKKKKLLIESKDEVIEAAKKELDFAMKAPEGEIYLFAQERGIKGEYTFDISIHEKGKTASVFCDSREGGSIKMQNTLKDFIKEFQFYFKMPKGKKYKFTYVFKFK
ncbi:MAG: hypothetical protein GXO89_15205 [Chlorobi bacterium]|nr:hypothetical protein [Chlorobiota bacterium]